MGVEPVSEDDLLQQSASFTTNSVLVQWALGQARVGTEKWIDSYSPDQ